MLLCVHMFASGLFQKQVNKEVSALSLSEDWLLQCDMARGDTFAFWVPYPEWGSILFLGPTYESRQLERHCDVQIAQGRIPESLPWFMYQVRRVDELRKLISLLL